ncbi:MAG: hypothetical protein ABH919_02570 [bacterium]
MSEDSLMQTVNELKEKYENLGVLPVQVQIGGTQRSGKTTIAEIIVEVLKSLEKKSVLVDIDITRTAIFAEDEPKIGSPLQALMQSWAYNAAFLRVSDIFCSGGTPVMTATHSRVRIYQEAKQLSKKLGSQLKFIILESPTIEEVAKRCQNTLEKDKSDMRDIINDPVQKNVYKKTLERFRDEYKEFNEPHLKIPQGTLKEMSEKALDYILLE